MSPRTRMSLGLLLCLTLLVSLHASSLAGQNFGARAWLSWDKAGYVTHRAGSLPDSLRVYAQFEGLKDINQLAFGLRWLGTDTTQCIRVVSEPPDPEDGWVVEDPDAGSFYGDTTYHWRIHFPDASADRHKIAYTLVTDGCPDATTLTIEVANALCQDSYGALDTIAVVGSATLSPQPNYPWPEHGPDSTIDGFALVHLRPGTVAYDGQHIALTDFMDAGTQDSLEWLGFQSGQRVFDVSARADTTITTEGGVTLYLDDPTAWYVLSFDAKAPAESLATHLRMMSAADNARSMQSVVTARFPSDPDWALNWCMRPPSTGLVSVNAPAAWDVSTGSDSVTLAIIDSGIDYYNPDFEHDPVGRTRTLKGYDFADHDDNTMDRGDYHGTGCATFAAAEGTPLGQGGYGLTGLMWRCKILPLKVFGTTGPFTNVAFPTGQADAFRYAAAHGAQIVSSSIGSKPSFALFHDIMSGFFHGDPEVTGTYKAFASGSALFAAAGNTACREEASTDPSMVTCGHVNAPAYLPWIQAVSGSEKDGNRVASFSYGPELDLLAPGNFGVGYGENAYEDNSWAGSSMATPLAAGTAGLVLGYAMRNGITLSNEDLYGILRSTTNDVYPPGRDDQTGYGVVDASRALSLVRSPNAIVRGSHIATTTGTSGSPHGMQFMGNMSRRVRAGWYQVQKYWAAYPVAACGSFSATPAVWARGLACRGYDAGDEYNAVTCLPYGEIVNAGPSGFTVRTYVYHVLYDVAGRAIDEWYPCRPEQAVLAWTAMGVLPLQDLDAVSEHETAYAGSNNTWTAATCASMPLTYEWREQLSDGSWSAVLGTARTYTRVMPLGLTTVKVKAMSTADTLEATSSVVAVANTVSVPEPTFEFALGLRANPTRGSAEGEYSLRRDGIARMRVFDLAGRCVRTLVNEQMRPGKYHWQWDGRQDGGSSAPAGVYLVRLDNAGDAKSSRVILLH